MNGFEVIPVCFTMDSLFCSYLQNAVVYNIHNNVSDTFHDHFDSHFTVQFQSHLSKCQRKGSISIARTGGKNKISERFWGQRYLGQ